MARKDADGIAEIDPLVGAADAFAHGPEAIEGGNFAEKFVYRQGHARMKLYTGGAGDVLLTGSITAYRRSAVSFPPRDILSVRDFEVELVTRIRAAEKAPGLVLVDRELTGRTTVRLGGDLASTARQALPLLANDLAKKAVALLAEGEW